MKQCSQVVRLLWKSTGDTLDFNCSCFTPEKMNDDIDSSYMTIEKEFIIAIFE